MILGHRHHNHHYYPSQQMKEQMTTRHVHIQDKETGSVDYDLLIIFLNFIIIITMNTSNFVFSIYVSFIQIIVFYR